MTKLNKPRISEANCNRCGPGRDHYLLDVEEYVPADSSTLFEDSEKFELLRCCGCRSITVRRTSYSLDDVDRKGRPLVSVEYYPPATFRPIPNWHADLALLEPDNNDFAVTSLLMEIYNALNIGALRLTLMGIRALLETVMITRVGDQGSFKKNLERFCKEGDISQSESTMLLSVIEAGSAVIHRQHSPSREDLTACLDMAEAFVKRIYFDGARAAELRVRTPRRITKPKEGE